MRKKRRVSTNRADAETPAIETDCKTLLRQLVDGFKTIPQKYCLFCEANAALGIEAHKADCPFRLASHLVGQEIPE